MIKKVAPILPALNMDETLCFYRDKLKLNISIHPDYLLVYDKNIEIHFYKTSDKYLCDNSSCIILVSNIEDMYLCLSALDIIHPKGKLETKPWGHKEFSILDNNGNLLRFTERP